MAGIPYNRISVISNAFIILGKPKITSIQGGGPVAADADQIYDSLLASELSSPDWRFATDVVQLSQVAGVNPNYKGFRAAFQKPAGLLAIWQIWPTQPYEIFGERIWTLSGPQTIQVEYRKLGPESKMPPVFLDYFTLVLAYNLGIGLTESDKVLARIEGLMNLKRSQAMAVNAQERPNKAIQSSPWIQNRGDGYGGFWGVS